MSHSKQPVSVLIAVASVALLTLSIQSQTELFAQIGPGSYPSTPGGVGRPGGAPGGIGSMPTVPRSPFSSGQAGSGYTPSTPGFTPPTSSSPNFRPSTPSSSYSPSMPSSSFPSGGSTSFGPSQSVFEYSCSQCGKSVTASAKKCPHCGVLFTHTEFADGSGRTSSSNPFSSTSSSRRSNADRGFAVGILIGGVLFVLLIIGGTIALVVTLVVKASKPKPRRSYGPSPGYANQQFGNRPGQYPNQFTSRPPSNPNQFR